MGIGSILFMASALSQQSEQLVRIEQVMTPQELKATGIVTLTPAQRAALNKWLTEYTWRIMQLSQRSSSGSTYLGLGSGHWIKEKGDGGSLIILEDGSVWKIHLLDRIYTTLWLPITSITVLESESPIGNYKYLLINIDDGEKALAKYLGK